LDWTAPGVEASVLSECRQRLRTGQAALLLFATMLTRVREQGLRTAQGRQRPDSTPVLAAIQTRNRLECSGETRRPALQVRAPVAPDWRQSWVPAVWFARSRQRFADSRLPPEKPARDTLATQIGMEGRPLLGAISAPATPAWRRDVPAMQTLRPGWLQQCSASPDDQPGRWRHADDLPPAPLLSSSPDAPEARSGQKRATAWTGYTVPRTATCDDETPPRLTAVLTTPAPTADVAGLPPLQATLATRQVTPREPCGEAGSVRADPLLTRRSEHGLDRLGPGPGDQSWPGPAATGCAAAQWVLDWDSRHAICPPGQRSVVWTARPDRHGPPTVRIAFRKPVCAACASRADGTHAATTPRA